MFSFVYDGKSKNRQNEKTLSMLHQISFYRNLWVRLNLLNILYQVWLNFIWSENNCHWKDEECSADLEVENENNHHETESSDDTDKEETDEMNTQVPWE